MKKIITFISGNEKSCMASVTMNSFKQFSINYLIIDNSLHFQNWTQETYDYKRIRTDRRESILLAYIDKHCVSSLNEIFEIKN